MLAVGFFGWPLLNEGSGSTCRALEDLAARQLTSQMSTDNAMSSEALEWADVIANGVTAFSRGKFATTAVKRTYPYIPPFAGCALLYYRHLANPWLAWAIPPTIGPPTAIHEPTTASAPAPAPEQPNPTQTAQLPPRRVEEPPQTPVHRTKYPGPAATRKEYLAYVHSLIRQHYNMLPLSMVGDRHGETLVEFLVLVDGTISMIKVRQSSGYPDIDARIEQMVAAVRRVPPLPQWFQGPSMGLILSLPFPDALRE
jgi:TonB family protein